MTVATRQIVDDIVKEATEELLGMIEMELDEGDWRDKIFQLTEAMGATPAEHAEIMGLADTLASAAVAKALMARITQHTEEQL